LVRVNLYKDHHVPPRNNFGINLTVTDLN